MTEEMVKINVDENKKEENRESKKARNVNEKTDPWCKSYAFCNVGDGTSKADYMHENQTFWIM